MRAHLHRAFARQAEDLAEIVGDRKACICDAQRCAQRVEVTHTLIERLECDAIDDRIGLVARHGTCAILRDGARCTREQCG